MNRNVSGHLKCMMNVLSTAHGNVMERVLEVDQWKCEGNRLIREVIGTEVQQTSYEHSVWRANIHTVRIPLIERVKTFKALRSKNDT